MQIRFTRQLHAPLLLLEAKSFIRLILRRQQLFSIR